MPRKKANIYWLHLISYAVIIGLSVWIFKSRFIHEQFLKIAGLRLFGEFISGAFYTSFITVPLSIAMYSVVAETSTSPTVVIALIGSIGAMLTDYAIDRIFIDLYDGFMFWEKDHHIKLAEWFDRSAFRRKIAPVVGMIVWISPLPDDFALILLGTTKMKPAKFFALAFTANFLGIFLLVESIRLIQGR